MHAYLPPVEAIALQEHLEQAARPPADPDDGRCRDERMADAGKHRYRPSPELAEYVRARDRYCRRPGSTRSARRADLDHVIAYQQDKTGPDDDRGGSTSSANLAALSRRVHRAKTHGTIALTITAEGTVTWTTPDGYTYTAQPHNYFDGL